MRIAILGWGSLIWKPDQLLYEGDWSQGGPVLPIEFSRISSDGRLTLVIDLENGEYVPTQFVTSSFDNLINAIENLRTREDTSTKYIGYINLVNRQERSRHGDEIIREIQHWAELNNYDAVIWTDLPSNFHEKDNKLPLTVENAVNYLHDLSAEKVGLAKEYIQNAPEEIDTPLRRKLSEIRWIVI